jgi:hypothetical protein
MAAVAKLSTLIPALPLPAPWRSPTGHEAMPAAFARMAEAAGSPPGHLMADFAQLAFGPGRISFADYERLRLYDGAFWEGVDRREVAGVGQARRIARIANFRRDCWGLATDRVAANAYLAAHGLPIAPALAIYRAGLAAPGDTLLRTRDELRQFLEAHADAPLIARPSEGGPGRRLFAGEPEGRAAEIDRFIEAVNDAGPVSWLFQTPLEPRADVADGRRLAPVRLITLAAGDGVVVARAAWRFGGPDDVIAGLDVRSGAALRLSPALAPQRGETAPPGLGVPDWSALKAAACEGARLFAQFGLIGWDIAPTAGGPVILGLDPAPDLDMHQLADRRGVLDAEFLAFLAQRRALAADCRQRH